MLSFPNCKINLGLNILRKREDGFHDLETIFYPVYKLHDALEILAAPGINTPDGVDVSSIDFQLSGLVVDGDTANNLCIKAYQLLKKDFPELPAVRLHLHKAIPMGAGLGGGSADGAFTLKLLNEKFHLQIEAPDLIDYALQLGSDCPFFIVNKSCFARGRGEIIKEIDLDLSGYSIVLINPGIHVSTGWAFGHIIPKQPENSLEQLIAQPIERWRQLIENDFETAVANAHPIISTIKSTLYEKGALYASMSGSGSTVYGIFLSTQMPSAKLFPEFLELHLPL
ncbi:MAG: 4-(cytidine 5'-diphospho)-2-C-methyl-D-erythritol kinase [Bacteroidota bacterium]